MNRLLLLFLFAPAVIQAFVQILPQKQIYIYTPDDVFTNTTCLYGFEIRMNIVPITSNSSASNTIIWKQCGFTETGPYSIVSAPDSANEDILVTVGKNIYGMFSKTGAFGWRNTKFSPVNAWISPDGTNAVALDSNSLKLAIINPLTGNHGFSSTAAVLPTLSVSVSLNPSGPLAAVDWSNKFYEYSAYGESKGPCNHNLIDVAQLSVAGFNRLIHVVANNNEFNAVMDLGSCAYVWQNTTGSTLQVIPNGNNYASMKTTGSRCWIETGAVYTGATDSFYLPRCNELSDFVMDSKKPFTVVRWNDGSATMYYEGEEVYSIHYGSVDIIDGGCSSSACYMVHETKGDWPAIDAYNLNNQEVTHVVADPIIQAK